MNGQRIEVYFAKAKFVRKNHVISRSKVKTGESGETYDKLEVDVRIPSGTDNELSALHNEIARFEVRWNGVAIPITPSLYRDCFNPGQVSCFPAPNGKSVVVEISGGDGGGAYGAGWLLRKSGKHSRADGPAWAGP